MDKIQSVTGGGIQFQIGKEIGSGGFATVYHGVELRKCAPVAIKMAKCPLSIDSFLNESRALQSISSKYVPKFIAKGFYGRYPWIAMERLYGSTLEDQLHSHVMDWRNGVHIGSQVALALQESSRHGLIHGDIKPSNIFIGPQGKISLIDWGLSEYQPYTSPDPSICCTPEYTSPEKIYGDKVDIRSDLYSLGIVLFEVITGRTPFEGSSYIEVFEKACSTDPDTEGLPFPIRTLIQKCLKTNPDDRYLSPNQILKAFRFCVSEVNRSNDQEIDSSGPPRILPNHSRRPAFSERPSFSFGSGSVVEKNHLFGIEAEKEEEFVLMDKRSPSENLEVANR